MSPLALAAALACAGPTKALLHAPAPLPCPCGFENCDRLAGTQDHQLTWVRDGYDPVADLHCTSGRPAVWHRSKVVKLAVAPNGEWLASLDAEGEVLAWDARDGSPLQQLLPPDPAERRSIAIRPDSNAVVVAAFLGRVVEFERTPEGRFAPVVRAARAGRVLYSGDGEYLVYESDEAFEAWSVELRTGTRTRYPGTPVVRSVPNTSDLIVPNGEKCVRLSLVTGSRRDDTEYRCRFYPAVSSPNGRFGVNILEEFEEVPHQCIVSKGSGHEQPSNTPAGTHTVAELVAGVTNVTVCDRERGSCRFAGREFRDVAFSLDGERLVLARRGSVAVSELIVDREGRYRVSEVAVTEFDFKAWRDEPFAVAFGPSDAIFVGTERGRIARFDRPRPSAASEQAR